MSSPSFATPDDHITILWVPTLRKFFLLLSLTLPVVTHADPAALEQAEKLYQSGEWAKAAQAFKAEIAAAPDPTKLPAALFFNYGTAAAKAGAVGEAYVALARAAFSRPLDSESRVNLRLVEKQVPAAILAVRPTLWFSWWPREMRIFPWQAWLLLALVSSLVVFWRLRRPGKATPAMIVCILLYLVAGSAWLQDRLPVYGVIQLAKVKSGPGSTFSDITTLEPGSLINQEATRDGWLKIRFVKVEADVETVGWLEPGTVLEVRRN